MTRPAVPEWLSAWQRIDELTAAAVDRAFASPNRRERFATTVGLVGSRLMTPRVGERVRVEGRRVNAYRRGTGSPAVVIEAGGGHIALDWTDIVDEVGRFTSCIAYDRAGLGWSDPSDRPRTPSAIARELRALLRAIDLAPPFVLVGHSLGGIFIRRFAEMFPRDTAALLMVDPSHPRQWSRLPKGAREAALSAVAPNRTRTARERFRAVLARQRPTLPADLLDLRTKIRFRPRSLDVMLTEIAVAFSSRSRIGSRALPAVPLVLLTRGRTDPAPWIPQEQAEGVARSWRQLHEEIAGLVPDGELIVADGGGHMIMWERPDLVVSVISRLVHGASVQRG